MPGPGCCSTTRRGCRSSPAGSLRPAVSCWRTGPGWTPPSDGICPPGTRVLAAGRARHHRGGSLTTVGGPRRHQPQARDQQAQGAQAARSGRRRAGSSRATRCRSSRAPGARSCTGRGRRGAPGAPDLRAARAHPAAPAARHRPVVPGAGTARRLPGRVPARDHPRRAARAHQRPAELRASRTARWAVPRSATPAGYEVPEWTRPDPESRPGSLVELDRAEPGAAARPAR